METIKLQIENVRNIEDFTIEIPWEKGLFAITGENGIGKSTIFSALSKLVYKKALNKFLREDGDSSSKLTYWKGSEKNIWIKVGIGEHSHWKREKPYGENSKEILIHGSFEAGVLFGSRFNNAHKSALDIFLDKSNNLEDKLVNLLDDADGFIKNNLGLILHSNSDYYFDLKRLSYESPDIQSEEYKIWIKYRSFPYFLSLKNKLVSYIFLSSGELLMIGLLDFISNTIARKYSCVQKLGYDEKYLILIDEIELALHPSAQVRLAKFLKEIAQQYNFVIYFATHSIPIIEQTLPSNIFHLRRNIAGKLECLNPCHPVYVTRGIYTTDGFDYLLLVEDTVAKNIIEFLINKLSLSRNKLIKILPAGGWKNILSLHHELISSNIAGSSCQVISILDGDIKQQYESEFSGQNIYNPLRKFFLPINSVEKTLQERLIDSPDASFSHDLGDRFFKNRSLEEILHDYNNDDRSRKKSKGDKGLYLVLKRCAEEQGVNEEVFKKEICEFIYERVDFTSLENNLKQALSG
jgi:energy-coupling factor transporter ATP-binding protein EcfA2